MIRTLLAALLLIPGIHAHSQIDRAKLRSLITLPSGSVSIHYLVTYGRAGLRVTSNLWKPQMEIAELTERSASRKNDPEILDRLGIAHQANGDGTKATAAFLSALDAIQKQLSTDSNNARLLARMGAIKAELGDIDEAEKLLRKSVQLAPGEWLGWQELSRLRIQRIWSELLGKEASLDYHQNAMNAFEAASAGKISSVKIAGCQKLLEESNELADRAVEHSPAAAEPLVHRALLRGVTTPTLDKLFESVAIKRPEALEEARKAFFAFSSFAKGLPDTRRAAELTPGHLDFIFAGVYYEYVTFVSAEQKLATHSGPLLTLMGPGEREWVNAALGRLESIESAAVASDPDAASRASEYRAFLSLMLREEFSKVETFARKSLKSRSGNKNAANLLMGSLAAQEKYTELGDVLEESVKAEVSVDGRVGLAKISDRLGKPERAEHHARLAVKLNSDSKAANMMLAGVLLKRYDDPASIHEAGSLLVKAGEVKDESEGPEEWTEYMLLRGFYFALHGELDEARRSFKAILVHVPENTTASRALAVLE